MQNLMKAKVSDRRNVLEIRLKTVEKKKAKRAQGYKVLDSCRVEMQIFICRSEDHRGSGK